MKTFLFSTLTLVVLAHPVLAADLPLKAPPRAPAAPIYGWDGFYLGGNVGYSWGKEDLGVIGFTVNGVSIPGADFAALRPKGTIAGGQAGFNWQAANWVFGIETDLQWSDEKDSLTSAGVVTSSSCFGDPNTPCALTGTGTGTLALTLSVWCSKTYEVLLAVYMIIFLLLMVNPLLRFWGLKVTPPLT